MESKKDLITYRLRRAKETLEDAEILAEHYKWNSCINRLYYACYHGDKKAIMMIYLTLQKKKYCLISDLLRS